MPQPVIDQYRVLIADLLRLHDEDGERAQTLRVVIAVYEKLYPALQYIKVEMMIEELKK